MIDSVVGRVEEHVGTGGSRFSESILEVSSKHFASIVHIRKKKVEQFHM